MILRTIIRPLHVNLLGSHLKTCPLAEAFQKIPMEQTKHQVVILELILATRLLPFMKPLHLPRTKPGVVIHRALLPPLRLQDLSLHMAIRLLLHNTLMLEHRKIRHRGQVRPDTPSLVRLPLEHNMLVSTFRWHLLG